MRRIFGFLVGLIPFLGSCVTAQPRPKDGAAGAKGVSVEDEWKAAEKVARDFVTQSDGKSPSKVRRDLALYSFAVRRADGSWKNVLVHNGRVVEEKGLGPLGQYLGDHRFLVEKSPGLSQLLSLLELYQAFPPVPSPAGYITGGPLAPKLEFREDGSAVLQIFYPPSGNVAHDDVPMPSGGPGGGPSGGPRPTTRASLSIPQSYTLAWALDAGPPQ